MSFMLALGLLTPSSVPSSRPMVPAGVLERYEARVVKTHTPAIFTFQYAVEQAGDRSMTQVHRVYRSGNMERDETFGIDEARIKPRIHIYRNRPDPYALEATIPLKAMYSFTYAGTIRSGNHVSYAYQTKPLNHLSGFAVTNVVIDGQTFLPVTIDFATASATAAGKGTLRYGAVEGVWVVTEVEATAETAKKRLREHFIFTDYHFPKSLPESTFGAL